MLAISLTIACSRYLYNGFILHAHPVRGESHNQRNATGEVATILVSTIESLFVLNAMCIIDSLTIKQSKKFNQSNGNFLQIRFN